MIVQKIARFSPTILEPRGFQGWAKSPRKQMTSKMALQFWTLHLFTPDFSLVVHQLPHNIILCGNTLATLVKQNCTFIQALFGIGFSQFRLFIGLSIFYSTWLFIFIYLGYVLIVFRLAWCDRRNVHSYVFWVLQNKQEKKRKKTKRQKSDIGYLLYI